MRATRSHSHKEMHVYAIKYTNKSRPACEYKHIIQGQCGIVTSWEGAIMPWRFYWTTRGQRGSKNRVVPSPERWQVLFCSPPQQHAIQASSTHPPSHTHTHSPGSKTGLFYLIFLREISVSLASSNFSLFITQKTAKKALCSPDVPL